jgi:hypothetical protein
MNPAGTVHGPIDRRVHSQPVNMKRLCNCTISSRLSLGARLPQGPAVRPVGGSSNRPLVVTPGRGRHVSDIRRREFITLIELLNGVNPSEPRRAALYLRRTFRPKTHSACSQNKNVRSLEK